MTENIRLEHVFKSVFNSVTGTLFNAISTYSGISTFYSVFYLPFVVYNKTTEIAKAKGYNMLLRIAAGVFTGTTTAIISPMLTIPELIRFELSIYLNPLSTNILGYTNQDSDYLPPSDAEPTAWKNNTCYTTQKLFTDMLISQCVGEISR